MSKKTVMNAGAETPGRDPSHEAVLLEAKDLCIGYGKKTVTENVTFSLRRGEILCLLGPNGCGKSTLLRTLSGAQPALSGEILLEGEPLSSYSPTRRATRLSIVTTDREVKAELTSREVILLGRYPYMNLLLTERPEDTEILNRSMEMTGTAELAGKLYRTLSDGQKQRIMLARALCQDTPLILLDEPASFLDLYHQIELIRMLKGAAEQGKAMVIALHDTRQARVLADRILAFTGEGRTVTDRPEVILNGENIRKIYGLSEAHMEPEYAPLWQDRD